MVHRTTIVLPNDLHDRLRDLGFKAGGSISTLLMLAAYDALGPLLQDAPDEETLRAWTRRLHAHRSRHDKRLRRNRSLGRPRFKSCGDSSQTELP